jgi:hypothetical protein
MSFASQAREEIAQRSLQLQKDCCVRAAAYGIACFAKYFDARGLVLQTEQELTARVAEQLFARCGVQGTVLEKPRPSGVVYEFGIREPEQVRRMHELFGTTGSRIYKVVFVGMTVVGSTMKLGLAWDLSDTFNGLMMIPNLIGVLALSGTVVAITKNYLDRRVKGLDIEPMWSAFEEYQKEEEAEAAAEEAELDKAVNE